ncbi:Hypothetical predicted protein [Olea europaea subsp. europaea]|uniref:Uncharacterized protein n=1 Tax=Olea europaea subsp. europaea TaxID=158383 RepID=A0A8S0QY19_OLEEU|nr:Hypothetical predicted protein [Olea europaea subsp. europaea]
MGDHYMVHTKWLTTNMNLMTELWTTKNMNLKMVKQAMMKLNNIIENDDDLFIKYVHEVVGEETLPSNIGGSDIMHSNEEEYCDFDILLSDNSEDGEGMQYPEFIAEKDMKNPQFITGRKILW